MEEGRRAIHPLEEKDKENLEAMQQRLSDVLYINETVVYTDKKCCWKQAQGYVGTDILEKKTPK